MSEPAVPSNLPAPSEEPQGQPGFWRRMFGGAAASDPAPVVPAPAEGELGPAAKVVPARPARNQPRPPKGDDDGQRRFARAAMLRREKLARAIGERVEQVLLDRLAEGETRLAVAQEGVQSNMGEVKGLLGAIGRNLDDQSARGERVARILEQLPAASEREREALLGVARAVEGQGQGVQQGLEALHGALDEVGRSLDAQGQRAERTARVLETLPDVVRREAEALDGVSLTLDHHGRGLREGLGLMHDALRTIERDLDVQGECAERTARVLETLPDVARREHQALVQVRQELELQRDQRERMLDTLRAVGTRLDERFVQLEARLDQGAAQARADASSLRVALEGVSERISAEARATSSADSARTRRIEQGLGDVSRRLGESNALHASGITSQNDAMSRMHDAHAHLMDALQSAQSRALGEVQRLHDEAARRAEQVAWRSRLALVGSAGLVAFACLVGFGRPTPPPVVVLPAAAQEARPGPAPTTLPAGFRRAEAAPVGSR